MFYYTLGWLTVPGGQKDGQVQARELPHHRPVAGCPAMSQIGSVPTTGTSSCCASILGH